MKFHSQILYFILTLASLWSQVTCYQQNSKENTIVMTMMMRDEAVNIRSNLPLWKKFIDYFIFLIDKRTTDDTERAISEILGKEKPYQIISYEFEGFGPARTLSLEYAWKYYSQASHVWIADPDWRPELDTMNKKDLDLLHDAFRFLIYDRNGITTRRCDWLLRHRKGLAMRYHLHEVLDIGETYSPIPVKWVVREIEQRGSWHTTVGHGHSMSAARYKFDLELLEKDKKAYGHNPHTHHYLGITHQAYAEGLLKANGLKFTDEIHFHLNESITYFTKRITEVYEPEFLEERWACMYSLGGLYIQNLNDHVRALRWFKACHEFSPQQTECALAMLHVYESLGVLNQVVNTLEIILTTQHEERGMLNHFKHWVCDIPVAAVKVMNYKFRIYRNLTVADAKYMVLVAGMAQSKQCQDYGSTLPPELVQAVQVIAKAHDIPSSVLKQSNLLCKDPELRTFLLNKKYNLHPCTTIHNEQQMMKICQDFGQHLVSPVESIQIDTHGEFIGAASIFDLVHHIHGGRVGRVYRIPSGEYRILFAEYFNIRNVFSLIYFAVKYKLESILKITILSSDMTMESQIRSVTQFCLSADSPLLSSMEFVTWNGEEKISDALLWNGNRNPQYFNYVEYNGGISLDSNHLQHLQDLKMMIGPIGAIGVTVYLQNIYQERIVNTLQFHHNKDAHPPFSQQKTNLVKEMLNSYGLERYTSDKHLLSTLANPTSRYLSKNEIVDLMDSLEFNIISWFPTALMNPYDSLPHEPIQRFRSYGLPETEFIHSIVTPFRVSLYISQQHSHLPGVANYSKINDIDLATILIDRKGDLATEFATADQLAKSSLSLTMTIPFTASKRPEQSISLTIHPYILGSFSLLSTKPTFQDLVVHNIQIGLTQSVEIIQNALIQNLNFLFKMNYLIIWIEHDDNIGSGGGSGAAGPAPGAGANGGQRTLTNPKIPTKKEPTNQKSPASDLNEPQEVQVLESGLALRKRVKTIEGSGNNELKKSSQESKSKPQNQNVEPIKREGNLKKDTDDDSIPPICRIPGMSVGTFCQAYQEKKDKSTTIPPPARPQQQQQNQQQQQQPPPPQKQQQQQQIKKEESVVVDDAELLRIENLKQMGFTDKMIQKLLQRNGGKLSPKQSTASVDSSPPKVTTSATTSAATATATTATAAATAATEKKEPKNERPAICSLPGINAESLCKAYEKNGNIEKSSTNTPPLPIKDSKKAKRKLTIPEYQPQTRSQLLASFRNPNCDQFSRTNRVDTMNCEIPTKFKRTTSGTIVTSRAKIRFDVAQLDYILQQMTSKTNEWPLLQTAFKNMTTLLQSVNTVGLSWKADDAVIALTSAQKLYAGQLNNHVIHLANEVTYPQYTQEGAMNHIQTMMQGIESMDFLVVDGVLFPSILTSLVEMILQSTIWFDVSTGNSFISHSDDGLIHSAFYQLGKEFEDSLTPMDSNQPYLLNKYYAIAVDQYTTYSSPIALGDADTIHVIVWLNGNSTESVEGVDDSDNGVEVMSVDYTSCLMNLGIDINIKSHPDFASKMGSLKIGALSRCDDQIHELIRQKQNRVIIFGPGISFRFTSGVLNVEEEGRERQPAEPFTEQIIIGIVYVFTRTEIN